MFQLAPMLPMFDVRCVHRPNSKIGQFYPTPLAFVAPYGVILFEFCRDLGYGIRKLKSRPSGLSCGIIYVILRLAVLTQYGV